MIQNDINLLTKEEKSEQFQKKAVKFSTVLAIFLLIVVGGISAYFWWRTQNLEKEISLRESEIDDYRSQVRAMAETEIVARNLYKKYTVLNNLLGKRFYYSTFLAHFNSKIPEGVEVSSFSFKDGDEISIAGTADNYLSVSRFLRNLTNEAPEFRVFTFAQLNSVTLNSSDTSVDYSIVVGYNAGVLTGGN